MSKFQPGKVPVLVVFDIDETLLQFLNVNPYKNFFKTASDENMRILKTNFVIDDKVEKNHAIIFRPLLGKFFDYVRASNGMVKIALWTYSEHAYAEEIKDEILKNFPNAHEDDFVFTWGAEDMFGDYHKAKDLQLIWDDDARHQRQQMEHENGEGAFYDAELEPDDEWYGGTFNKFNTFLVDDRYGNLAHGNNVKNSILVQAFAPFGEGKPREELTPCLLDTALKDNMFDGLIDILTKVRGDIAGCDVEDIRGAFDKQHVLDPAKCSRKNLDEYIRDYECTDCKVKLLTLGKVENAASSIKGGKKRSRKTKRKHTGGKKNKKTKRKHAGKKNKKTKRKHAGKKNKKTRR